MKKIMLMFSILVIGLVLSIHGLFNSLNEMNSLCEKALGQEIIIEKDTLTIVDYSLVRETFILSNGKEVNFGYTKNKMYHVRD